MTLSSTKSTTFLAVFSLTILHRPKAQCEVPLSLASSFVSERETWATCLREIAFVSDELSQDQVTAVKGLEIHREEGALVFLLEVLCGLRSPVLGETEVMGQFKTYLGSLPAAHPLRRDPTLVPFLQSTVKEARTRYLRSLNGSLSYGQVVRRWLKDSDDVVMWGFGSLGSEIWPWVKEKTKHVVVRQMRSADEKIPFVVGETPGASAHVIAAPLPDEKVRELADAAMVIDLRDRPLAHPHVRTLQELFEELGEIRREREDILPLCRDFLREKVQIYMSRSQIRPFGWEDLCG